MKYVVNSINSYPHMEVQDALKLIYQSEFGCGHLIENEDKSYAMLLNEWENTNSDDSELLFEEIGSGYARFNIGAAKAKGVSSELFQKIFLRSAVTNKGTLEDFYQKVEELKKLSIIGEVPFKEDEIHSFIGQWQNNNCPLFRHSEKYREEYRPSYRVVLKEFIALLPALMRIESEANEKEKVIVGIDGPCGAGKTTLSNKIADFYGAQVIRMDDFFLPPILRSEERLEEPGGNIHYERFCDEVASKVNLPEAFKYRVFTCSKMDFDGEVKIQNKGILIIEGSYSMHPLFDKIYDIKLYCNVDPEEQKRRIIERNGLSMYKNFEEKWIPMEAKYFKTFGIKEKCDFMIS